MLSDYERELSTHYAQVRKRLRGEIPKPIVAIPPRPAPEPEPEQICEIVQELNNKAFARTTVLGAQRFLIGGWEPLKSERRAFHDVLKDVSRETGVSVKVILGKRRMKFITEARRLLWWRVAHECPHLSIADIGRRSGVDHTSVLHGLKRYAEINGLPYPAERIK